jgi:hypothetical protein
MGFRRALRRPIVLAPASGTDRPRDGVGKRVLPENLIVLIGDIGIRSS